MIEKMKYINLMGPVSDLDRVAEQYLSRYEIQLEHTVKELTNEKGLQPFTDPNLYAPLLRQAEGFVKMTGLDPAGCASGDITRDEAIRVTEAAMAYFADLSSALNRMTARRALLRDAAEKLFPFISIHFQMEQLREFEFIQYQFGRMPISSFKQFEAFLYDDAEILFEKGRNDGEYLWGVYFAPESLRDKVGSMFSTLHFERIDLPLSLDGVPLSGDIEDVYEDILDEGHKLDAQIAAYEITMMKEADTRTDVLFTHEDILRAYVKLKSLSDCFDTRKYAARTENDFFIFVGWMTAKDAVRLEKDTEHDEAAVLLIEDYNESIPSRPPTKLRNTWFIRPFEFFVRLYGLPSHDELDPTPFVALTYTILFGIMFADVGQGLLVSLLGFALWKKKRFALGKIMCVIGLSSMLFGALFGSVFGNEELIPALWMHPAEGPDSINNTLIYAIGFGVLLILISMSFHIANAIRKKRLLSAALEPSGIAGAVFYITALMCVMLVVTGHGMIAGWLIGLFIVLPLLAMMFRHPLLNLLQKKKKLFHGSAVMFLFESLIEMFEVLLGYFSNTVSFMRVGAFALSHASIMGVVWMLSHAANGTHNYIVIIFGNLLVIALEGLIAGIQVLRLQFYEMFSRFYEGSGRAFTPFAPKSNRRLSS